jgi:hypothetical protein
MSDIAYQRLVSETKTLGHITSLLMESRFRIFLSRNSISPEEIGNLARLRGGLTTVNEQLFEAFHLISKAQTMLDELNHIGYPDDANQAFEDAIEDCDPDGDRDYKGPNPITTPGAFTVDCPACGNSLPLNADCRCSGCGNG